MIEAILILCVLSAGICWALIAGASKLHDREDD